RLFRFRRWSRCRRRRSRSRLRWLGLRLLNRLFHGLRCWLWRGRRLSRPFYWPGLWIRRRGRVSVDVSFADLLSIRDGFRALRGKRSGLIKHRRLLITQLDLRNLVEGDDFDRKRLNVRYLERLRRRQGDHT